MNTKVVKSFGLALIVAVGVLALLLATGTFSPQKAGAQDGSVVDLGTEATPTPITVSPNDPAPGAARDFTVTFKLQDDEDLDDFDVVGITLEGFGLPSSIEPKDVLVRQGSDADTPTSGEAGLPVDVSVSGGTITLELDSPADGATGDAANWQGIATGQWAIIRFRQGAGLTAPAEAGTYDVTVDGATTENAVTIELALTVDSAKGGSATEITVSGKAFANGTGSLYTETLKTPDANGDGIIDAIIEVADDITGTGLPNDAALLPGTNSTGEYMLDVDADGTGDHQLRRVEVDDEVDTTTVNENLTSRYVALVADAAADVAADLEGDGKNTITLGYKIAYAVYEDDTATPTVAEDAIPTMPDASYNTDDADLLKDVTVSDGAFSTTISAGDLKFGGTQNMSYVRIVDANGDEASARFQVTGTMTLGSDSVGKGRLLKISLSDWIIALPDEVKIGGVSVAQKDSDSDTEGDQSTFVDKDGETADAPVMDDLDEGALDFYVKVSGKVGLGTKSVVLFEGGSALEGARDSLEITASDLTVSPSTAVVGREVTVTGSGFDGDVNKIEVGDVAVCDSTDAVTTNNCAIEVASGGRVVAAFNIPNHADLAKAGDYTIMVTDTGDRIGTATVTIPERTLTVDPTESRIGTTIDLSGTGWPTGTGANLVAIYYDSIQYASAISRSDGTWSASVSVPDAAGVGETHDVEAKATVGDVDDNVTMEADHATPDAVVTLSSAQAQRGTRITVSGANFNVFHAVEILIGDSPVTPSPAPTTDADGSFSAQVLVPGLSLGNKNLKVTVKEVPVVEFLEIIAAPVAPVSADPADVFADLIEADTLVEVLQLVRTSDTDITWLFYKPGEMFEDFNTYSESESGDILFVNVSSQTTFQGKTLYTGWNQHVLN